MSFDLQPLCCQSRAIRSTLFVGVSEGVDAIYFLVHEQITGSKFVLPRLAAIKAL